MDVRTFVKFDREYFPIAISSDGARVAFSTSVGNTIWLGLLDLTRDTARLLSPAGDLYYTPAAFSPDGRLLLYRVAHLLRTIDLGTGSIQMIAEDASVVAPIYWLRDGRIAYVDEARRLLFLQQGASPVETGFRFTKPGKWYLQASMAVSPDGTRVLYSDGCAASLVNLSTRTSRALGRPMGVPELAWSPDGAHFVLQKEIGTFQCQFTGGPGVRDILFDREGQRIGVPLGDRASLTSGQGISWSTDGRWLLISSTPTGTEVSGLGALFVVDVPDRSVSYVINSRLIDFAFVGPGNWIVFSKYRHDTIAVSSGRDEGAVKVGRLAPT